MNFSAVYVALFNIGISSSYRVSILYLYVAGSFSFGNCARALIASKTNATYHCAIHLRSMAINLPHQHEHKESLAFASTIYKFKLRKGLRCSDYFVVHVPRHRAARYHKRCRCNSVWATGHDVKLPHNVNVDSLCSKKHVSSCILLQFRAHPYIPRKDTNIKKLSPGPAPPAGFGRAVGLLPPESGLSGS
jgi:hypothetical protein